MTEQDLIHKIEWVNKRCSLKGEPFTQNQIELLIFVFADNVVKNIVAKPVLCDSLPPSTVDFNSQICWDENQDGKLPPSI
jgi:hypothetical protein